MADLQLLREMSGLLAIFDDDVQIIGDWVVEIV